MRNEGYTLGEMVKAIFAKIASAKQFLWFFIFKNTPARRKKTWGNPKCFRSTTTTVAAAEATATATAAAETFVVTPGTFPSCWSDFQHQKSQKKNKQKNATFLSFLVFFK